MRHIIIVFVIFLNLVQPTLAKEKRSVIVNHEEQYSVVINHEEQYSIWLQDQKLPSGWKATGFVSSKDKALKHIEKVWTKVQSKKIRRNNALEIYKKLKQKK